jgi:glycosyltransferase involved in cell wall biosynthesis
MSRVLLVCPEPLGHGQPAGIGIRFIEFARVLFADGHRITVLSPDGGGVPGCDAATLTAENIARLTSDSDVAVVQGHAANALFAHGSALPTVVDLYDPFIIENLHYYGERGPEVFTHDHATLLRSLMRGDLFLCASDAQRLFYLGCLLAIGRLNPVSFEDDPRLVQLIALAPFGVQAPRPHVPRNRNAILFGGIYDWYDPILAIDAVAAARAQMGNVTLTFTRHPNPHLTPQGKAAEAVEYVKKRGYEEFIRFEPWFAYDQRAEFFERFGLALITFRQSLETDLSMRTRIYDYLWGGLPIVTSSAPGTNELLGQYGAGSVVATESADDFARAIVSITGDDSQYARCADGAGKFVQDHQWPAVLDPLRQFCRTPRMDRRKDEFLVSMNTAEVPPSILDRLKRRIGAAF